MTVAPYETKEIDVEVVMTLGGVPVMRQEYVTAKKEIEESYERWQKALTQVSTDSDVMNNVMETCILDLRSLIINTKKDLLVPAAGIPWYDTIFGRDSLITSFQTLMLNPELSQSTLRFLTIYQGNKVDTWTDEQPGKILHEIREGELANLHHIPHTPYYGTIDATLLYLILMSEYYKWTGDEKLLSDLKSGAEAAVMWMDELWRHRQGRLRRVHTHVGKTGPAQPGLEGLSQLHRVQRRQACHAAHRAVRSAGLRI